MKVIESKILENFESLLARGIRDFESGSLATALQLFRRAAVKDLGRPEAWFWMGRVYEESGDRVLAGHSFYMAGDRDRGHLLANAGLRRLGYLQEPEPQPRSWMAWTGLDSFFKGVRHDI